MSCPVMKGEDVNFSEKSVQDITSKIISRLDNVVTFYGLYRDVSLETDEGGNSENILDRWINARMSQLIDEVTKNMEMYDMSLATRPFDLFIEDLSTWYLRRSRETLKDGDKDAKKTLYKVLKTTVKLLAPFTPFIAEDIWQKLKNSSDAPSVHLSDWPKVEEIDENIISEMGIVRHVVTLGLEARQKAGIKVRQPLNSLSIKSYVLSESQIDIVKDELNIKSVVYDESIESAVKLDTHITIDLKKEGQYRELLRAIQDMRKEKGLNPSDIITLEIETNVEGQELINTWKTELMKIVGAKQVDVKENEGVEVKIDELSFVINVLK
jgi:isoleucyl-tRNA synthetase